VLTWAGQPIDAFFHSTCGGRTAAAEEVFASAARPYLRSIRDLREDGTSWCASSPRFRWREEWPADRLRAILQETLPPLGGPVPSLAEVRDVRVTARTPTGRVHGLRIDLGTVVVPVSGPAVRQVLRPAPGQLLRSAAFDLRVERDGPALVRLVAEGHGAGHGVGLCQWGTIGRARAGWDHRRILAAYFPGTELERHW
jgi:stage II sporulation protein D